MSELIGRPRLLMLANRAYMIVYAGRLALRSNTHFPFAISMRLDRNLGDVRLGITSCAMVRLGTRNCASFRLIDCPNRCVVVSKFIGRARLLVPADRADMIVYAGFLALRGRANFPLTELMSCCRNFGHICNCIAARAVVRLGTGRQAALRCVNCPAAGIVVSELIGRPRLLMLANRAYTIVYAGFLALRGRANFPLAEVVSGRGNFGHIRNCITSCAMMRLGTRNCTSFRLVNCPTCRIVMVELIGRARLFVLADRAYTIVYTGFLTLCRRADFPRTELVSGRGNCGDIRNCITSCAMVRLGTRNCASFRLVDCPSGRIVMSELIGRPRLLMLANRAYMIVYAGFFACCGRANLPLTELVSGCRNFGHICNCIAARAMVGLGTGRQAAFGCVNCPAGRVIMSELIGRARLLMLANRT